MLVYGHYDVQPAEPLELWTSPPFEPTVRDGRIYARGSVDDKGQLFLHVKALEAHLAVRGTLPVNVIVLAEGEEEVGSEHLAALHRSARDLLRCDAVVISDSAMFAPGLPALLSSLRGLAYFQIDVQGPAGDLHSGSYGGAVVNPAMALARILATMHDAEGRVAIPGFYDAVREWPASSVRRIASCPSRKRRFRDEAGVPRARRRAGLHDARAALDAADLRGERAAERLHGRRRQDRAPAKAMAKVSCRLVPDQDPGEIERLMSAHVERVAPRGVHGDGHAPARRSPAGAPSSTARSSTPRRRALAAAFGREPVITGEGGSIPVVGDFERMLGAPALLLGLRPARRERPRARRMAARRELRARHATIAMLFDQLPAPRGVTPA